MNAPKYHRADDNYRKRIDTAERMIDRTGHKRVDYELYRILTDRAVELYRIETYES